MRVENVKYLTAGYMDRLGIDSVERFVRDFSFNFKCGWMHVNFLTQARFKVQHFQHIQFYGSRTRGTDRKGEKDFIISLSQLPNFVPKS